MSKKRVVFISFFIIFILSVSFILSTLNMSEVDALGASSGDRIHFINVGNGDSILIESGGKYGLIDAGKKEAHVANYLKLILGDNKKLSFVILTHRHKDHYGGMLDVLKGTSTTESFISNKTTLYIGECRSTNVNSTGQKMQNSIISAVLAKGGKVIEFGDGPDKAYNITGIGSNGKPTRPKDTISGANSFKLGNFELYLMNLEHDHATISTRNTADDDNRNSIVTLVTHSPSGKTALLAGDMETDDEDRFLCTKEASTAKECRTRKKGKKTEKQIIQNIDILKLGHHGTNTANQISFLSYVNPSIAIVSIFAKEPEDAVKMNMNALRYLSEKGKKVYVTGYDLDNSYVDFTNTKSDTIKKKKSILITFKSDKTIKVTDAEGNALSKVSVYKSDSPSSFPHWTTINWGGKDGKMYYTSKDTFVKDMYKVGSNCYMFHSYSGVQLKGWLQMGGRFFYFSSGDGYRLTGTNKSVGGSTEKYTFNTGTACNSTNGYLVSAKSWGGTTGILKTTSKRWFYLKSSKVQTGWQDIKVKVNGKSVTGRYYFEASGKFTTQTDNGLMVVGLQTLNDPDNKKQYVYYFEETEGETYGMMQKGMVKTKSGDTYYFNADNGRRETGWKTVNGEKFYFNPSDSGKMVTGFFKINGDTYYFKKTGELGVKGKKLTGWISIGSGDYYLGSDGKVQTGWHKKDGKYYYLRKNANGDNLKGSAVAGETITLSGKSYTFTSGGVCSNCKGDVKKPTKSYCNNAVYDGTKQIITKDPAKGYTFTGNERKNVNSYTVTASLTDGYWWGNYNSSDVTFKCNVNAANINDVTVTVDDQNYTGSAITPNLTVKLGSKTLTKDTDYTVAYSNNTKVGTASIVLTGKGNFNRTKKSSFKIVDEDIVLLNTTNMNISNNRLYIRLSGSNYINKTTLLNNVRNNSNKKIRNKSDVEVTSNNSNIGTGFKIKSNKKEYPIVVSGDLDGTGTINANDLAIVYKHLVTSSSLNDLSKAAGDIDGSGTINVQDIRNIYLKVIGAN